MKKMTLLVGPIASGKSTFARNRAAEGALVVNDDAIVTAVHGGDYSLYSEECKPIYVAVETAIISGAALLGRDVVVDRGCRNKSQRERFARLGGSLGFEVGYKEFQWESPAVHAERRMRSDPRGYSLAKWTTIAEYHHQQFEPVGASEKLAFH